jgi:hypothetical protein
MKLILPEQENPVVGNRVIDPLTAFHQRQCAQLSFEVPLQM